MPRQHAPRGALKAKTDPMKATDPMEAPRCTARNKQGNRCGKSPIIGGNVCRLHGGAAPQVKMAALARLEHYRDRAAERLCELIELSDFPSTSLGAVKDLLDRTLGKPTEKVDVSVSGELSLVADRLAGARRRLAQKQAQK